jgi:hypothetical protein
MPAKFSIFLWKLSRDRKPMFVKSNPFRTIILLTAIILLATAACSSNSPRIITGTVKAVNYDTGEITVNSINGRLDMFSVGNSTRLLIPDTTLASIAFEPGLQVKAEVTGKIATTIQIDLVKIYGIIQDLSYNQFTLQPVNTTRQIQLSSKTFSVILKAGVPLPLNLLTLGQIAEVYYNPVTMTAFQIKEMPPDFIPGN